MKINGNEIRPGNVVEHNDSLWVAVKVQHVKPGKGGAFAQVELKNLLNGSKLNERFRSSETVVRARMEQRDYQYLYTDGDILTFMDTQTYEQITVPIDLLGDRMAFLSDGMMVIVESHNGRSIGVRLPEHVECEVSETEPVVKGQTATSSYKPAVLTNGIRTMVPPFVLIGDKIVVNSDTAEYIKRAD